MSQHLNNYAPGRPSPPAVLALAEQIFAHPLNETSDPLVSYQERVVMNSRVRHIAGGTAESAYTQMLHELHDAALWRYAPPLTSDRARAENIVQETLRAWQHPIKRSGITR